MALVFKLLIALLQAIPALRTIAAEMEKARLDRAAATDRAAKDARNKEAIAEAQKAIEPPPSP